MRQLVVSLMTLDRASHHRLASARWWSKVSWPADTRGVSFYSKVQTQLISTVERLAEKIQPLPVEASALSDVALSGLPIPAWTPPPGCRFPRRPWSAGWASSLAVNSIVRAASKTFGQALDDAVRHYDHQLRTWMRDRLASLKAAYDSQVDIIRQQSRHGSGQFGRDLDPADVEQDLRRLESIMADDGFDTNRETGDNARRIASDSLVATARTG